MLQVEKKNYIVAIDLGSQNVTAAAATRGADGKMVVEAVVRKPSGGVAGGAIENIEMAREGSSALPGAVHICTDGVSIESLKRTVLDLIL